MPCCRRVVCSGWAACMTLCPWQSLSTATYEEILCLLWKELNVTLRHCSSAVQLIRPLNKTATLTVNIIMMMEFVSFRHMQQS